MSERLKAKLQLLKAWSEAARRASAEARRNRMQHEMLDTQHSRFGRSSDFAERTAVKHENLADQHFKAGDYAKARVHAKLGLQARIRQLQTNYEHHFAWQASARSN
jgi:hypothetical protein